MSSRYNNTPQNSSAQPARKGWRTISSNKSTPTPTPPPASGGGYADNDGGAEAQDFNSKTRLTDAEYEEALARQQSAYEGRSQTKTAAPAPAAAAVGVVQGPAPVTVAAPPTPVIGVALPAKPAVSASVSSASTISKPATTTNAFKQSSKSSSSKSMTVHRSGGGKTWEDNSLLDWDPSHFRLFVGNLSGEVTDETLQRAFQPFGSLTKVKVVRDNKTQLTKGYGFVAFRDPEDYFRAFKTMNNKYIGNHPVQLRKATTDVKPSAPPGKHRRGGAQGGHSGAGKNQKYKVSKGQNSSHSHNIRYTPSDKLA